MHELQDGAQSLRLATVCGYHLLLDTPWNWGLAGLLLIFEEQPRYHSQGRILRIWRS
jgi:hypothetical protein